jgi:hypothetical protein
MDSKKILEKLIAPMTQENAPKIAALFLNKTMANRHVGIKPDVMQIWKKQDLLWSEHAAKTKKSFSMAETVWLGIVRELRRFKVTFEGIRELKRELQVILSPLADDQQTATIIRVLKEKGAPEAEALVVRPEFKAMTQEVAEGGNMLVFLIYYALHAKKYVGITYKPSGEWEPTIPDFVEDVGGSLDDLFLHGHHIHISISHIVNEIMGCANIDAFSNIYMAITAQEQAILVALREKGIKSVKVSLDNAGEIKFVEVTKANLKPQMAELVEAIRSSDFNDITIRTENGRVVMFENTAKHKQ